MADKKTGLGVDALFPPAEPQIKEEGPKQPAARSQPQQPKQPASKQSVSRKRPRKTGRLHKEQPVEEEKSIVRRTTWIRQEHFERLELLKHKERARLHDQKKRATVSVLIDEAIEKYLADKEGERG